MDLKEALIEIYKKAKENYQFKNNPKLFLRQDKENASNLLYIRFKKSTIIVNLI